MGSRKDWEWLGWWVDVRVAGSLKRYIHIQAGVSQGYLQKFRSTREPAHETHVLVRTGLLRTAIFRGTHKSCMAMLE